MWKPIAQIERGKLLMLTPMFSHMTSIIRNGAMHNKENTLHTRAASLQSGSLNTSSFWLDMGERADSFKTCDWPTVTFPVISLVAAVSSPTLT